MRLEQISAGEVVNNIFHRGNVSLDVDHKQHLTQERKERRRLQGRVKDSTRMEEWQSEGELEVTKGKHKHPA